MGRNLMASDKSSQLKTPQGSQVQWFSTFDVPKGEKVDYWRHVCSNRFSPLERLEPDDSNNFEGLLCGYSVGSVNFSRISSSSCKIARCGSPSFDEDMQRRFYLFWYAEGGGRFTQLGNEAVMRKGDFVLIDTTQPYLFECEAFCNTISVELSEQLLTQHLPAPESLNMLPMRGHLALNRMAGTMIECLHEQAVSGNPVNNNAVLVHGMLDVIAAAYSASSRQEISGTANAMFRRQNIKRYIEANLANPNLSPGEIAANNRISPRYLRLLFAEEQETVSRYILRRRLEECVRRLEDPAWKQTSITDIALSWGFNDMAHFGRSFREYYNSSPGEYRRTRLSGLESV